MCYGSTNQGHLRVKIWPKCFLLKLFLNYLGHSNKCFFFSPFWARGGLIWPPKRSKKL